MPKSGYTRHVLLSAALVLTGYIASVAPVAIYGQATSGDLVGTAIDPSGAAVPHAFSLGNKQRDGNLNHGSSK
jgi:hypothetical protein